MVLLATSKVFFYCGHTLAEESMKNTHVYLFLSVLVIALSASAHAYADTFTFDPARGINANVTLNNTSGPSDYILGESVHYSGFTTNGSFLDLIFLNAQYASSHNGVDVSLYNDSLRTSYNLLGPQLYTGSEQNPMFASGTFQLPGSPQDFPGGGGTLIINGGSLNVAATPEPSSVVLLGTATLAALGVIRRRFSKA